MLAALVSRVVASSCLPRSPEGDPAELALGLWAAAHGVASLLVAKPYFPWPDRDAFIDRTVCMAGIGLAAAARFDADNSMPLDQVVATLDRLRG